MSRLFEVTITETSKLTVKVEANNQQEAEQIVSDQWNDGQHVLDYDNFVDVEFDAVPIDQDNLTPKKDIINSNQI